MGYSHSEKVILIFFYYFPTDYITEMVCISTNAKEQTFMIIFLDLCFILNSPLIGPFSLWVHSFLFPYVKFQSYI